MCVCVTHGQALSEYSSGLCNVCQSVREEADLQMAGWTAVLRNCSTIIRCVCVWVVCVWVGERERVSVCVRECVCE